MYLLMRLHLPPKGTYTRGSESLAYAVIRNFNRVIKIVEYW
jgi:hypothetical protein